MESSIGDESTAIIIGSAYDVSTNTLYGVDAKHLYAIDPATGDQTATVAGLAIEAGVLFMVTPGGLYQLNKSTGAATLIGAHGLTLAGLAAGDDDDVCSDKVYVY